MRLYDKIIAGFQHGRVPPPPPGALAESRQLQGARIDELYDTIGSISWLEGLTDKDWHSLWTAIMPWVLRESVRRGSKPIWEETKALIELGYTCRRCGKLEGHAEIVWADGPERGERVPVEKLEICRGGQPDISLCICPACMGEFELMCREWIRTGIAPGQQSCL